MAIGGAVLVAVGLRNAATTAACSHFARVRRALILAIEGAILIGVIVRNAAATPAFGDFVRIVGAPIVAVQDAILVGIGIANATATHAVDNAAAAYARHGLVGIVGAEIHRLARS